ncbi:uncharacterized protein [Leptinotarsa decemlineata]|uniref:uncharacterized protein n=1 Tax=Leptinotarsa decemlineata TaxID=7539 RepID=UPI003D30B22D
MEMKNKCILCDGEFKHIIYNLASTRTRMSGSLALTLIEEFTEEKFNTNLNICENCLELINELDEMRIRVADISNVLGRYIQIRSVSYRAAKEKIESNLTESELIQFCADDSNLSVFDKHFESIQDYNEKPDHTNDLHNDGKNVLFQNISPLEPSPVINNVFEREISTSKLNECVKENINTPELKHNPGTHNPSFVCEVCGKSYKHKRNFESHSKQHAGCPTFSCTYCQKFFLQKGDLIRHVAIHTGEKLHQCEKCGKRFTHHTSFNMHIKTHTGKKTHKCNMCERGFTSTSHLKRHIRMHTGDKKFSCSRCGKRFAERYNLVAHEQLHNSKLELKRKKFSCHICGDSFEKKQRLEEHKTKEHFSLDINICQS